MKKMTYLVMALAMVLGFTQCKKEQAPANNQTEGVFITLNVNGGASTGSAADGSRVVVTPGYTDPNTGQTYAKVEYEEGDVIYVGYKGAKVGTLEYSGGAFSGSVSISEGDYGDYLHFYFLGGTGFDVTVNETDNTASVNISNQTEKYPVISYNTSNETFTGTGSYSSRLKNKVSIMKFNVDTPSTAPICITGMNNTVTLNFDPTTTDTDEGFSYSKTGAGVIKMAGGSGSPAEKWAIVLPQAALEETGDAFSEDNVYFGTRPALSAIGSNQYLSSGVSMTVNTPAWDGDLSMLTEGVSERYATATNGMTISGTLTADMKVSIAAGATVTLDGVTINGTNSESYQWAGLTCLGDATIILKDGTENTVKGFYGDYPGIYAAVDHTLIIKGGAAGTGKLTASSNGYGAGIGGGRGTDISCGNIEIQGGDINATGGENAAGIGSGYSHASCGDITITGGTVTATGGDSGAGIGSGYSDASCGAITITGGAVTATGGDYGAGIGSGFCAKYGAITITGGTVTANGGYEGAGIGGGYSDASCGDITITGGTVTATGGENAAGIGSSFSAKCGAITITGGTVTATGCGFAAGIGSGCNNASCGAITITGGDINATGGKWAAGIGSGCNAASCGDITITGGTVTATGGERAAGIGSGFDASCGDITITNGVTKVTATKGEDAPNSIGAGFRSSCGTVTIGGTLDGNGNPVGGQTGPISESPYTYQP